MNFSIPDTTEISAKDSSTQQAYTLFNIHINDIHHCSLRYSQLHTFNEELHRLLPTAMTNIDLFPPKKFFSLSSKDTDERRIALERYLQSIIQNKYIFTSSYFNEFFLNAQRETFAKKFLDNNEKINLNVHLLNNHEIVIENLSPNDNTSRLLDACANKIQIEQDFISYFALYFYLEKDNLLNILRPLYDFESPYISLKQFNQIHEKTCIVLKKSYWDSNFDLQLMNDRRTRNLLLVQAQYEIQQSQMLYASDIYRQLEVLYENKSLKDYLLLARTSKFYGHIFLRQCSILYPINDKTNQKLCQCLVAIGNNKIVCYFNLDEKKKTTEETSFKVIRIRSWKTNRTKQESSVAIEYLLEKEKKNSLEWIVIHTEQAPLISTCLQSMVDEILAKKTGATTPVSGTVTPITTTEQSQAKVSNGPAIKAESAAKRLTNNDIFDRGGDDDDL